MSQENVDSLVRLVNAWEAGDRETIFEGIDPGADWQTTGVLVDNAYTYRGRDEIMRYLESWVSEFDELRLKLGHVIGVDDLVVADVHASAVGKQSKAPVEADYSVVFRWRNGMLFNARNYATRQKALEAAGLSE